MLYIHFILTKIEFPIYKAFLSSKEAPSLAVIVAMRAPYLTVFALSVVLIMVLKCDARSW